MDSFHPTLHLARPGQPLPEEYFDVRFEVLRKPLGSPRGSERLTDDLIALHAWAEVKGRIVAVGRAALIAGAGAVTDPVGSHCPAFAPLTAGWQPVLDDLGNTIEPQRPAFQIRQMGTLPEFRGRGLAALVLKALEQEACRLWSCQTGWLQARTHAQGFYASQGWAAYGPEYDVDKVGPHRSMWKRMML